MRVPLLFHRLDEEARLLPELKDTAITITVLMPGPTAPVLLRRADMVDNKLGNDPTTTLPSSPGRASRY